MTDRNAPAAGKSLPALTCCGERMLWHAMLDKVVCPKCAAEVAGEDIMAAANLQRRRPYAPGEKMTDRHPDSVIAQVVEETIEKRVQHLAQPVQKRKGYDPLAPQPEPAFRLFEQDGALYVDTKAGPVKITADPTPNLESVDDRLPGGGSSTFNAPYRIGEDEMQAETPRVVTTCPGWNGVFSIDPDPPDLAHREAARVAEHQRREMRERGPFDYDVPSYAGILKAPYEQPARPDGFDQHKVDAAKAALLAPAPPRYPRVR